MSRLLAVRIVLAIVGIVVWGYGAHVDSQPFRWGGIAVLALSLLLRFARRR